MAAASTVVAQPGRIARATVRLSASVDRLGNALRAPVDGASLAAFRIAFGAVMAFAVVRFFAHGWIADHFVAPARFFAYPGLGWIRPLPGAGMYALFAVMGACAVLIAVGLATRWAAAGFAALFTYTHLCDKSNYLNHYYLVSLLAVLLVVVPSDATASLRALRRGAARVPAWAVWILRAQLAIVYFFGGVAKLQPDWLVHAQPLKTWLAARADLPLVGGFLGETWAAYAVSWGAALFDLTIAAWLVWPRTRRGAYLVVLGFHLLTARLFHIGMFPWLMMALTPVFFDPAWPRRLWRRWSKAPTAVAAPVAPPRALLAFLGLWLLVQIAVPLRFLAYPGYHLWTEQGFRWAWKVMVMEKSGVVAFDVRDPDTGRRWRVAGTDYWTRYQAVTMATQPDMIRDAACVIADDFRAHRGVARPEVRADVMVSLDGRPPARLIDPTVDLAAETETLAEYRWILPAPDIDPP